jgi:hypothetical protein
MYTCDQCRELLWDLLYDLLEVEQSQAIRDHLAGCAGCRVALEQAEAGQQLLSMAARFDVPVRIFQVPPSEAMRNHQPAAAEPPATLPLPRRGRALRFRPWTAAAAAVLLAVGLGYGLYYHGLAGREAAVAAANGRVNEVKQQGQELRERLAAEKDRLAADLGRQYVHVDVLGPASYQPGVSEQYRVQTRDLNGRPLAAHVTVRLINPGQNRALAEVRDADSRGDLVVKLPPGSTAAGARLEVVARSDRDRAEVAYPLPVSAMPRYVTHLALDKQVYRPGDIIFFRSATLDAVTLQPALKGSLRLTYVLHDAAQHSLCQVIGDNEEGGLGGGEIPLGKDLPDGEYTLTVDDGRGGSAKRKLLISRVSKPAAAKGPEQGTPTVEFFPEGGDLIAGVSSRVYVRVRTPVGHPADLDGTVIDSQGKEVSRVHARHAAAAAPNVALGLFTFTPQAGEEYRLKFRTAESRRALGWWGSVPLPPSRASGLVLSVPTGVTGANEPIRVVIAHADEKDRELVVGVSCRGRLVAEEAVTARRGTTEVRLNPGAEAAGVLRVTVFEQRENHLLPRAERLIYRAPAEYLDLSAKTDKDHYRAGEAVRMTVQARSERGTPIPAWLLVAVVDEHATGANAGPAETSLPAQFYLTAPLGQPADLERADLLLRGGPQAAAALDLFLGTQGWRRFDEPKAGPRPADPALAAKLGLNPGGPDDAALVRLDNGAVVTKRYETAFGAAVVKLDQSFAGQIGDLATEQAHRLGEVEQAESDLQAYRTHVRDLLRTGLGALTLALFVLGCVAFGVAVVRVALHWRARPYFGTAFAALLVCVVTFFVFSGEPPDDVTATPRGHNNVAATPERPAAGSRAVAPAVATVLRGEVTRPATGRTEKSEHLVVHNQRPAGAGRPGDGRFAQASARFSLPKEKGIGQVVPLTPGNTKGILTAPLYLKNYPAREYAPLQPDHRETVLWCPAVKVGADGTAEMPVFACSDSGTAYRVLIYGHSPSGRLGVYTQTLHSQPRMPAR